MVRVLTLQEAQNVLEELEKEWGVSSPPLYVSEDLPRKYAGVYHDVNTHIRIRPQYLTGRTMAHEYGHHLFHVYRPGECTGASQECEEVARMVESWWVGGRKREAHSYGHGRSRGQAIVVTTYPAMTVDQLNLLADTLCSDSRFESIESVGLSGDKLVLKLSAEDSNGERVDGAIIWAALLPLMSPILALVGITVLSWKVSEWLGTIGEWGPWILAMLVVGTAGLVVLYLIMRALAPPKV